MRDKALQPHPPLKFWAAIDLNSKTAVREEMLDFPHMFRMRHLQADPFGQATNQRSFM